MADVLICGRPLNDLVWNVLKLEGHLAPAVGAFNVLARADGPAMFGSRVTVAGRSIIVGLDLRPTTLTERTTTLDTLARLFSGALPVQFADDLTRVTWCMLQGAPAITYYDAIHGVPACYVEYTLAAVDPYRYDLDPTTVALTTSRASCMVGNTVSAPRIWLYGAATAVVDPIIIVRNAAGDEVSRLTFSVSLASTTALDIDCAAQTVDKYVAGVLQTGTSAGLGTVVSGDFPLLDPADGVPSLSRYPTIELTSTSGTATGLALYARRW